MISIHGQGHGRSCVELSSTYRRPLALYHDRKFCLVASLCVLFVVNGDCRLMFLSSCLCFLVMVASGTRP